MRKYMKILALAGLFTVLLCGSALAAEETVTGAGFYNVKSGTGLTVAATNTTKKVSANVDGKEGYEDFCVGSDGLTVTVSSTDSANQYLVLLAAGSGTDLPTADSEIYYIDQKAGEGASTTFAVLPKLPTATGAVKLFVTSDATDFATKSTELGYAKNGTYDVAPYVLGDVNSDNKINTADASLVLRHATKKKLLPDSILPAAEVTGDGKVNTADASKILRFATQKITSLS